VPTAARALTQHCRHGSHARADSTPTAWRTRHGRPPSPVAEDFEDEAKKSIREDNLEEEVGKLEKEIGWVRMRRTMAGESAVKGAPLMAWQRSSRSARVQAFHSGATMASATAALPSVKRETLTSCLLVGWR
jgi:hypothetical protein